MDMGALTAWARRAPLLGRRWWWRSHLQELALYAGAYAVYLLTRGLFFADTEGQALDNAGKIMRLEHWLGIGWESGWQSWAVAHAQSLVVALNWLYILTYWPVILVTAMVLYFTGRAAYGYYRRVVVVSLALALTAFALFPVAPPFGVRENLMDTIQAFGPVFYGGPEMARYYNTLAAMPSLHFTWTAILGVLFLRRAKGWLRVAGVLYPTATFCAIIITGNHYFLDAVAGGLVAAVGFAVVEAWSRRRQLRLRPPASGE
ncbi:MAG: phosphatase PAP2 family protein [Dehalococcoidia bacterium]|nr:phosphatase PAP2 family protein [Dehalococcoidia bacterium]MSQ16198.1 phosphatase PAP2 family protein [Dehalococcoidia bacterium]